MDDASFFKAIIDLIGELQDAPEAVDVLRDPVRGPEINLFDAGLLESLTVIRLIGSIVRTFGVLVPLDRYGLENFFTLRSIHEIVAPLLDT